MPGFMPGIHVLETSREDVDGRDIRAFTPVFDGLCPAMTEHFFAQEHKAPYAETSRSMVTPCWRIFSRRLPGAMPWSVTSTGAM